MDLHFDVANWRQTRPPQPGGATLSVSYVEYLCRRLNQQTIDIYRHPYNPSNWLRRSITLSRLRYPELSVGDAYKAAQLCQGHLKRLDETKGWSLGHRHGFWMRDENEQDENRTECLKSALRIVSERARNLQFEQTESYQDDREGKYLRRAYPWMKERHRIRSDKLLQLINEEFAQSSRHAGGEVSCAVRRHAFGKTTSAQDSSELLGVFATRDLAKDESILLDKSIIWGCSGPGSNGDYLNLNGGGGCYDPIHPNRESDDASMDLRWIRDRAGKHAAPIIRNFKLLQSSISDGLDDPLDHPLIARMTPNYPKDRPDTFSFAYDIVIPNEGLVQLGIDIFANPKYDTWILFTIEARASNNSCGSPTVDLLNPLFSLFNHSCIPNVEWTISDDHQSTSVKAGRDIQQGEQLFVSYDGFIEDQPLDARRRRLWRWLDSPCQCERCVDEEMSSENPDIDGAWDTEEKPIFPEDALNLKN